MSKFVLPALALLAFGSIASAEPVKLDDQQLDNVVAGWANSQGHLNCGHKPAECGNNGWGNGADGLTPGSYKGGTAPSKSANASVPSAGKINTNPTTSNGR